MATALPTGTRAGAARGGGQPDLRDKFFGCIAGVHVGSAMAAPVEGWDWQRIEQEHGTLDRFLSYHHYRNTNNWVREPGTTEDGVERQKLLINAIVKKQDRVTAEDVRATWVSDMNPEAPGHISEPFEGALLAMAKTPMSARDIGKYCDYSGLVSLARSYHPIGLINAGDVRGAIEDIYEVGQLYLTANTRGIQWATVITAGVAAATRPGATVDSVIGAILDNCGQVDTRFVKEGRVTQEIERGLELTKDCADFRDLRRLFDGVYSGRGVPYALSFANEVVTKAVCIFRLVGGNLKEAIIAGVNTGRDADCLTACAAGLSGALSGTASLPREWLQQVDYATSVNPYTCSKKTVQEHADGLYDAFQARLTRLRAYADEMAVA
jgi:ADP-ribosylglycohydrolase